MGELYGMWHILMKLYIKKKKKQGSRRGTHMEEGRKPES